VRFSVDAWDPSYGTGLDLDDDLDSSSAEVDVEVELPEAGWRPLPTPAGMRPPGKVLFVDGVRRVDARLWIAEDGGSGEALPGLAASYGAGVVTCGTGGAVVSGVDVQHGLFTAAPEATDLRLPLAAYHAHVSRTEPTLALQGRLGLAEVGCALGARDGGAGDDDLLVVDGPLRGRAHLPRVLGLVKTHRSTYLPAGPGQVIGRLRPGERSPVFRMGTSWERYSWYLRLPCRTGAPWTGVVRVECPAEVPVADAVALAGLSQVVLPQYASVEYKDQRAPQNLYPIGGLERLLRRRLGDVALLRRGLQQAAHSTSRSAPALAPR
jgi:hypothetical protein